jgi:hypothetical protein
VDCREQRAQQQRRRDDDEIKELALVVQEHRAAPNRKGYTHTTTAREQEYSVCVVVVVGKVCVGVTNALTEPLALPRNCDHYIALRRYSSVPGIEFLASA